MFSKILATSAAVFLAANGVNAECYEWDKPALHCFNGPWDSPQDVNIEDITYVGNYLRAHGLDGDKLWTMPAEKDKNCEEWEVFTHGSVKVLAKHFKPELNSSVSYVDIASTIDGGSTRDEVGPAIIQCLADGGFRGVIFDSKNPVYNTDEYEENNNTPDGVLIKVVTTAPEEL